MIITEENFPSLIPFHLEVVDLRTMISRDFILRILLYYLSFELIQIMLNVEMILRDEYEAKKFQKCIFELTKIKLYFN